MACTEVQPQALRAGELIECASHVSGHGVHISADGRSRWWGAVLTDEERAAADALRHAVAAVAA